MCPLIPSVFVLPPHQQGGCLISFCGISDSHFPALGFSQVQLQSALYEVRVCLCSHKHKDMIKTCLRRSENMRVLTEGQVSAPIVLSKWVFAHGRASFLFCVAMMPNRAEHLHAACRLLSLGGMLNCCWFPGSSTELVEAGWHYFCCEG